MATTTLSSFSSPSSTAMSLPSTTMMPSTVLMPVSVSASSPSPSPSETPSGNQSQGTPSSLYLFTFLTTLLLLLTVSFGIVLRSFVLRRRFRRRVEAAIAAGVLLPGSLNAGRGDRRLQEKPKLWEVWMDEEKAAKGTDGAAWDDIMPISAQVLTRSTAPPSPPPPAPQRPRGLFSRLPFVSRPAPPLPTYSPPTPATAAFDSEVPRGPDNVQVTVLIAMPSAARAGSDDGSSADRDLKGKGKAAEEDEDEELPEVCFGTTEVVVRELGSLGLPQLSPAQHAANAEEQQR